VLNFQDEMPNAIKSRTPLLHQKWNKTIKYSNEKEENKNGVDRLPSKHKKISC
jgi:hypothetical protein